MEKSILKENPDVRYSNLNPLVHYSSYGLKEGRKSPKIQEEHMKQPTVILKKRENFNVKKTSSKIRLSKTEYWLWKGKIS